MMGRGGLQTKFGVFTGLWAELVGMWVEPASLDFPAVLTHARGSSRSRWIKSRSHSTDMDLILLRRTCGGGGGGGGSSSADSPMMLL